MSGAAISRSTRTMTTVAMFIVYAILSAAALLLIRRFAAEALTALKSGGWGARSVIFAAEGVAFYSCSFLIWLGILTRSPVSRAYPIGVGLTLVLTTIGARFMLGETLGARTLAGMAAVFLGVLLLS